MFDDLKKYEVNGLCSEKDAFFQKIPTTTVVLLLTYFQTRTCIEKLERAQSVQYQFDMKNLLDLFKKVVSAGVRGFLGIGTYGFPPGGRRVFGCLSSSEYHRMYCM